MAPRNLDFAQLRTQAEAERERSIDAAHVEFRKTIEAIERVERLVGGEPPVVAAPDASPAQSEIKNPAIGLRQGVRKFLNEHTGPFSLPDLVEFLSSIGGPTNRTNISGELYRLQKREDIVIVQRGGGTTPHVYKRKPNEGLIQRIGADLEEAI